MSGAPTTFDREALRGRRRRALAAPSPGADFLMARAADDLGDRLGAVLRRFEAGADLFSPTPHGALAMRAAGVAGPILRLASLQAALGEGDWLGVVADEETPPLAAGSIDLAVSLLALQSVNDVPGVFAQIRRALRPDGLFVACMAGGATLTELREAFAQAESEVEGGVSPRVFPFADVRDLGALLQRAGFALPVTDVDAFTVRYSDPLALMRDLRAMGATNAMVERRRTPLRRDTLMRMMEIYAERFSDPDGRVRATFELVWLSGWSPHESQQKPLRPGSAQARLADALGVPERPAGEKPGA